MTEQTGKVLVVDDNESVRTLLDSGLKALGYAVEGVPSAVGIDARLAAAPPAAVLLDIVMEEQEGIETLMQLKRDHPTVPVIMISSYPEYLDMASTLGADAALEKPIDLGELTAVLESLGVGKSA
jgi:two-component system chemotaxis response regulator CheY/two-component system response regulator AtoC